MRYIIQSSSQTFTIQAFSDFTVFWLDLFLCVLPSDYAGSSRGGLAQNSHYDYGRGNAGQQPQMSTFFSQ